MGEDPLDGGNIDFFLCNHGLTAKDFSDAALDFYFEVKQLIEQHLGY